MLKKLLLLVFAIIVTANLNKAHASHIPGANITYECDPLDPLTYTFTLTLFRICPGTHPATMSATYFSITNTCGLVNPVVPIFNQTGVAEDVNQLCATATSDCSGGTSPGLWKYTYQATITLPADCDSWTIGFDLCCRDISSNLTGTSSNNMATSTTMNTVTAPCDNSPVVSSVPMPYACANTPFNYCLSIADPEGDSTTYTMVAPAGALQAPIVFLAGYSAAAPLTGFVLDPLTGCFTFNEPNIGNYVVAIAINSWDSNGDLICTVIHDFQIIVMSCTNTPPANPAGGLINFQGTGALLGPNTVGACFGDNICFDVVFADPMDPTDNITIQQDGTTLLPGATFVQTGTNPATGTFCWLAQPGYTGAVVTFVAEDDGCPVMGTSGFAVNFNIATGVFAGPDPTICGAQNTPLSANGANNYVWSPAAGLSCTTCTNPIATPAVTTTYTLTGDLVGSCPNVDQVTVNVVPDFTLTMNPLSATICANEVVQLNASGPGAMGPYTYDWTPTYALNDPTIGNPLANPLTSTTYTATLVAANGCTKTADVDITVSGVGPTVEIVPAVSDICAGESVPFTTTAFVYPVSCGISAGCSGTNSSAIVGTSTTSTTSYSPFYGSTINTTNYTNKTQYIYTAAELNALGYYGGTIRSLSLYFTNSYTYVYDAVDIWIGCTTQDQFLSTAFTPLGGMVQVFSGNNINPTNAGWHTFNITDYDWDGTSNIIIQMCAQEDGAGLAGSESVRYTSTSPAYRCMYYHTTLTTGCASLTGSRVTNRPNMRFGMCVEAAASPTYTWTPAAGLSNAGIANPTATPATTTSYVLDVTANGCTGSGIAQVNVGAAYSLSTVASPISLCYGASTTLDPNPSGPGPYTYSWSPAGAFGNPNDPTPTVTPTGTTTYYIECSNGGCTRLDSITVDVAGLPVSVFTSDDTVCIGTDVNLDMLAATGNCGINYSDCNGTSSTAVSAIGASATTTYGPFYGSTIAYTNKKQYIFTAAELTGMGFSAGMITELALDVSTSTGRSYDDVTIWMGCTAQDQYATTTFIPTASMDQVYFNSYYTTSVGWNTFDITGFDWDGTSNIVIQFCAKHNDMSGSESTRYTTTTPAYRCLYFNTSLATACSNATGSRVTNRPNMRFTICSGGFGAGATYSWSPSAGLSNPSIATPTATINGTTIYTLTVTDPLNPGCPSSANVQVAIDETNTVVASNDTTYCPGDPAFDLNAQYMINGVPASASTGSGCYDQTITYANPALLAGSNTFNFAGTPPISTGGTLTVSAYGDLDGPASGTNGELWTIQDENSNTLGTAGGSNTQCGFLHTVVFPLTAVQINAWTGNGSIDFYGIDVTGFINTTLCGVGIDLLEMRLEIDCPSGSGYAWSPGALVSDSTLQNPSVSPGTTTTFVVSAIGGTCPAYDTVVVTNCLVLPLELTSFTGFNYGKVNELNWTTNTEINNDFFTVQRSIDGINFTSIGDVDGAGNSTLPLDYRLTDQSPFSGVNYYRLRQTDFDGSVTFSDVIAINTEGLGIQIYPNPTSSDLFLDINETIEPGIHTIVIIDLVGKVMREQVEFTDQQTTYKVGNFKDLAPGVYMIQVLNESNDVVTIQKVIKN